MLAGASFACEEDGDGDFKGNVIARQGKRALALDRRDRCTVWCNSESLLKHLCCESMYAQDCWL